ncbi:MAG TPA: hypothetical protein VFJ58_13805 [Armatimonadota bacterium]|nr:hypothetical protein [Armatimonadota bacterium]
MSDDPRTKDSRTNEARRGRLGAAIAWWVLLATLWMALVDKSTLTEVIAGMAAAAIGGAFAPLSRHWVAPAGGSTPTIPTDPRLPPRTDAGRRLISDPVVRSP